MKPVIELKEVWKIYKLGEVDVEALRGLSLTVTPGEFLALLGASGSGKSTALNLIGSLDLPTRGHVFLDGQDIAHLDESTLARIRGKKIGFVFQTFNLISSLTALENVMLPMTFQGVSRAQREQTARSLLDKVQLSHRLRHKPAELSGGERQRVAIARALVNDPEVILADEPTGNLDTKTGREILNILRALHKEGKTVVMITHEMALAKFAERVCYLQDGRIVRCVMNSSHRAKEVPR